MTISYQMAADMALILKYGDADQSVVAGLNKIKIPGIERSIIEVQEFRNAFSRQFAGGGKQGSFTYGGNYVLGDTKGQDQLKSYLKDNTKFTDARIYLNYETSNLDSDFIIPDTEQDSVSAFQVVKHLPGDADINGVIPFSGEIVLNGQPATMVAHITGTGIALVSGSPDTITDTGSGFVTAGFEAGQTLCIEGSAADDGLYTIASVAAGTITLSAAASMTGEAAGSSITLHGGVL